MNSTEEESKHQDYLETTTRLDSEGREWLIERDLDVLILSYIDDPVIDDNSEYEMFVIDYNGFDDYCRLRDVIQNNKTLTILKKFKVDGFEPNFGMIMYN